MTLAGADIAVVRTIRYVQIRAIGTAYAQSIGLIKASRNVKSTTTGTAGSVGTKKLYPNGARTIKAPKIRLASFSRDI
jgi:hypothetical protein